MTNEQKAYINELVDYYDHQVKVCSEAANRSRETFNNDKYSSYLDKASVYHGMKSDLERLLKMGDDNNDQ